MQPGESAQHATSACHLSSYVRPSRKTLFWLCTRAASCCRNFLLSSCPLWLSLVHLNHFTKRTPPEYPKSGASCEIKLHVCVVTLCHLNSNPAAGASCEIELHVCVDGGPGGAAAELANANDDFLDAIVILRVGRRDRLPCWTCVDMFEHV